MRAVCFMRADSIQCRLNTWLAFTQVHCLDSLETTCTRLCQFNTTSVRHSPWSASAAQHVLMSTDLSVRLPGPIRHQDNLCPIPQCHAGPLPSTLLPPSARGGGTVQAGAPQNAGITWHQPVCSLAEVLCDSLEAARHF